jgi:hypothetical protein
MYIVLKQGLLVDKETTVQYSPYFNEADPATIPENGSPVWETGMG